jgi:hypothetical protein
VGNGNRVRKRKEPRDGEISKLKNIIRRLESDKRKLLSEVKTLEQAFGHTVTFLRGKTKDLSLEQLIQAANNQEGLSDVVNKEKNTTEHLLKKWACHKCDNGVMRLTIYTNREGSFYFRNCTQCSNRTKVKPYNDKVTGVRDEHIKKN